MCPFLWVQFNISALDTANTEIIIGSWCGNTQNINLGGNSATVFGSETNAINFTATEGAEIHNENNENVCATVNGLSFVGCIDENGNIVIANDSNGVTYTVNDRVSGDELNFSKTIENNTTLLSLTEGNGAYSLVAAFGGVNYYFSISRDDILLATNEGTRYENLTFDKDMTIIGVPSLYKGSSIWLRNVHFNGNLTVLAPDGSVTVGFEDSYDNDGKIDFSKACTVSGDVILNGNEQQSYQDTNVQLCNFSSVNVSANGFSLALNGNCCGQTYNIDGIEVVVPDTSADEYSSYYYFSLNKKCYGNHEDDYYMTDHTQCDGVKAYELNASGIINSITVPREAPEICEYRYNYMDANTTLNIDKDGSATDNICIYNFYSENFPQSLTVNGIILNADIELKGKVNISDCETTDTREITVNTDSIADINLGSHSATIIKGYSQQDVSVTSSSGSILTDNTAGATKITFNGMCFKDSYINEDNNIILPVANEDAQYTVYDGDDVVESTAFVEDDTTVIELDGGSPDTYFYRVQVSVNGAIFRFDILKSGYIIANHDKTYENITFDYKPTVICTEDDYNNIHFENCDFPFGLNIIGKAEAHLFVDFVMCYNYEGRDFEADCTFGAPITVTSESDTSFNQPKVQFNNVPDVEIIGENASYTVNGYKGIKLVVNGVEINTGDEYDENESFDVTYQCNCYAEHTDDSYETCDHSECEGEQCEEVTVNGYVEGIILGDSCAVTTLCIYGTNTPIAVQLEKTTATEKKIRIRSSNGNDEPEAITVTGSVENNTLELDGRYIDISSLQTDNAPIEVGAWNDNLVNIGTHTVSVVGGGDWSYPVNILADSGADIYTDYRLYDICVNETNLEIGNPHIFGNEDNYVVYVGSANRDYNYVLLCNGELTDFDAEYIDDEYKTHLTPKTINNDLSNWELGVELDGVAVHGNIYHKDAECNHDFTAWSTIYQGNCVNPGEEFRRCRYCGYSEYRDTPINPNNHSYQWFITNHTHPHTGYLKCEGCGKIDNDVEGLTIVDDTCPLCLFNVNNGKISGNNTYSFRNLTIPHTVGDTAVTSIESYGFEHHSSLEYVVIEDGITEIEENAFNKCFNLKTVVIPDSVTVFGNNIFNSYHDDLVIICSPTSAAKQYAIDNGIAYRCLPLNLKNGVEFDNGNNIVKTYLHGITDFSRIADITDPQTTVFAAKELDDGTELFGTGTQIIYRENKTLVTLTLVVNGDLDGDSVCDVIDLVLAERAVNNYDSLTEEQYYAATGYNSGYIDVQNYANMVNTALAS